MPVRNLTLLMAALLLAACQSAKVDDTITTSSTTSASTAQTGALAATASQTDADGEEMAGAAAAPGVAGEKAATGSASGADSKVIAAYVPPQAGTVFTFRNNWSSLPPVVSYRVAGLVSVGEREYVKLTSVAGMKDTVHAYYDTASFALKGYRDKDDRALVTYKPVEERYRFPMKAGDRWVTAWRSYDHKEKRETRGGGVVEVIAIETVKLPAGEYRAAKVRLPVPDDAPAGMRHFVWFAPALGITVKEQITSGAMNWTQILEKIEEPVS